MLYIVATPIGNLQDITLRAIETLKKMDYILAEDTRHSLKLLQHLQIEKLLVSFHDRNEDQKKTSIIQDLEAGKEIAIISDAGTPLVSDPGFTLVRECVLRKIPITAIPGPSAAMCALILSGFSPAPFQFVGFLPKKQQELAELLQQMAAYKGTSLAFESPHRIEKTLEALAAIAPNNRIAIARELTKHFEEVIRGTANEILQDRSRQWRGELVLVIEQDLEKPCYTTEHIKAYIQKLVVQGGLTQKEALQEAAAEFDMPKRVLYKLMI